MKCIYGELDHIWCNMSLWILIFFLFSEKMYNVYDCNEQTLPDKSTEQEGIRFIGKRRIYKSTILFSLLKKIFFIRPSDLGQHYYNK